MREQYEIGYARFFNFPKNCNKKGGNDLNCSKLMMRPLTNHIKRKHRGGTWVSCSSAASLHIYSTNNTLLLLIYHNHKIYEEHNVCKLDFSWPQLSSVSRCPLPLGSRVVFATYKDPAGQVQKFGMRFLSSSESQEFISSLKECLNVERNFGIPSTYFSSENLYQNQFISAIENQYRADELINDSCPPSTDFNDGVRNTFSEERTLDCYYGSTSAPSLQRLTEFPADGRSMVQGLEPPLVNEEVDLNSRIAKYMTATSFNDVLIKLDKLINDMGGDLAL